MSNQDSLQRKIYVSIPNTSNIHTKIKLKVPAKIAWGIVGNFAKFDLFTDGLDKISLIGEGNGAVRQKKFASGDFVVDQLTERDEQTMTMHFNIILTSLNIRNLWEYICVEEIDDEHCYIIWDMAGEPKSGNQAELDQFLANFAKQALSNIAALCTKQTSLI